MAGAKSVLMSLWTVSDNATEELMVLFYQNWLSGKTGLDSFRTAQLALRTKFSNPYYWGAFVLVGTEIALVLKYQKTISYLRPTIF